MATVAKKVAVKKAAPAKAAKPVKAEETPVDEVPKTRGRQRDVENDNRLVTELLKTVTIEGEFPHHRTKGIGAAAKELGIDAIRARLLIDRMLGQKAGVKEPSPEAITKAREELHLNWGVIDAMFGTSRTETLKLYDELNGEGAHSAKKLYGQGGAERLKPEAEKKVKAERKAKADPADSTPRFEGEETPADIAKTLDGKTVSIRVKVGETESIQKVKVGPGTVKVGKTKAGRVVKFTDGKGNARTVALAAFVK